MSVPFVDFKPQYEEIRQELECGLKRVCEQGNFILGQEEKDFEHQFAAFCGVPYAIGVNSGTDALHLALKALDIGPKDEVIVPTFTFIATALAVSYTGAKPVFVDITQEACHIDVAKIKKAITPKTKAIVPVHLYGQPINMDEVVALAKEHHLTIIEDCAQAHGALYKNKKVGSLGDVGCFSFYPTKGLGAFGDGGMVVTKTQALADKIFMLRDYGRQGRYDHVIKGYNSRLDTLQAVVLSAKLRRLDQWNLMRQKAALYYQQLLKGFKEIILPMTLPDRTHVFQTFAILIKNNRDAVYERMREKGIGVLIHYPIPIHLQKAYQDLGYKKGELPYAERICDQVLSLPMFPHIKNQQIENVCEALRDALKNV